jgi:hypothetical protein
MLPPGRPRGHDCRELAGGHDLDVMRNRDRTAGRARLEYEASAEGYHRPVDDELDPKVRARIRRRDRDAEAEARALMKPGMGKVFKQILDTQARAAKSSAAKASAAAKAETRSKRRTKPKA